MSTPANFTVQNTTSVEAGITDKLFWPQEVFWGNGCKDRCAAALNTSKRIRLFLWVATGQRAVVLPLPVLGSVLQKADN